MDADNTSHLWDMHLIDHAISAMEKTVARGIATSLCRQVMDRLDAKRIPPRTCVCGRVSGRGQIFQRLSWLKDARP